MSVFSTPLKAAVVALAMSMLAFSGHAAPAYPVWEPNSGVWDFGCMQEDKPVPNPNATRPTHCAPFSTTTTSTTTTTTTTTTRATTSEVIYPTYIPGNTTRHYGNHTVMVRSVDKIPVHTHYLNKTTTTAAPTGPKEHGGNIPNTKGGPGKFSSIPPYTSRTHSVDKTTATPAPTGLKEHGEKDEKAHGHGNHGEKGPIGAMVPPHTSHTHSMNMTSPSAAPSGRKDHSDLIQNKAASVETRGRPGKPHNNGNGNDNNGGNGGNNGGNSGNTNNGGVGAAIVVNACPFSVHSNIVHAPRPGAAGAPEEIYSVLAPGQTATHAFSHDPQMGISWKIWRTDVDNNSPIQFEWTYMPDMARTWYDLSMIDAGKIAYTDPNTAGWIVGDADGYGDYVGQVAIKHAFADHGMTLTPMVGGNALTEGNCVAVRCAPGDQFCKDAYNVWNDWGQQRDCAQGASLKLTLCG
ncbi:hypothetical protein PV11_08066 [Exophiala sideris]|uniref:Uncharacterized protein n=1 Tax=Exophiala sideris TaxID=1016849 RepID=A0A0D1Z0Y2_9EURO|nr:hypothetical protein PV11_08066 [Exophiala sideris]